APKRGLDGVVCGHIHHAEIRDLGGILYCNDGDWVESCTALVEHFDGRLEIVRWAEPGSGDLFAAPATPVPVATRAVLAPLVGADSIGWRRSVTAAPAITNRSR